MVEPPEPKPESRTPSRLTEAERAFERGDFSSLSSALDALSGSHEPAMDAAEAKRTEQLKHAVQVDPWHVAALCLCLLGLLWVAASYL